MSLNMYRNMMKTIKALKCLSLGETRLRLGLGLFPGFRRLAVLGLETCVRFLLVFFVASRLHSLTMLVL
jgi:hypothetical protein